jgi:uncharacterized membrane protein YraQ (UPF0718 family)
VLPAAASLRKQGANRGATSAFLISTPESGVDSIAVSYALLDPLLTVVRPVAAMVSAMTVGFVENIFFWEKEQRVVSVDRSCPVDNCCDGVECPDEVHRRHHTWMEKIVAGLRFAYREVWGDIVGWFFVGLFFAAVITALVPDDLISSVLGGGLGSMMIMLVVGIPLYICATASTPVAAALILKGVSPGAALVFLLVGPATSIASLFVLNGILGRRSLVVYLATLSACAVSFGLAVDGIYAYLGISAQATLGEAAELLPGAVKLVAALLLLVLSVQPLGRSLAKKLKKMQKQPPQTTFFSSFPTAGKGETAASSEKHLHSHGPSCGCGH